jgi:hypothetical protein
MHKDRVHGGKGGVVKGPFHRALTFVGTYDEVDPNIVEAGCGNEVGYHFNVILVHSDDHGPNTRDS